MTKLKIEVDVELPAWAKKALRVGIPIAAISISGAVFATPKQWTTGDPLTASDLNNLTVLTANGVKYSIGATHYCGMGPVFTSGNFNFSTKTGFAAAKAMCESSCSDSTAHMCSAEELARSQQLRTVAGAGWYTTRDIAAGSTAGTELNDCKDWTSAGSTDLGMNFNSTMALSTTCNITTKVLCCD